MKLVHFHNYNSRSENAQGYNLSCVCSSCLDSYLKFFFHSLRLMFVFVLPFFVVSDRMLDLVFILYRLLHFLSLSLESRVLNGLFCCQESLQSMHSSFGYRNKDVDKNWFSHEILKSISKQKLLWHSSAALNSIFSKKKSISFLLQCFFLYTTAVNMWSISSECVPLEWPQTT